MKRIFLSWNINGLRAVEKKGFKNWLLETSPDIIGLQETKAWPEQLSEDLKNIDGYYAYFSKPQKKGYSGVGVYTKEKPLSVNDSLGNEEFDAEGRLLCLEYPEFYFITVYFPNGGRGEHRVDYKLRFYAAFLEMCQKLSKRKYVITLSLIHI